MDKYLLITKNFPPTICGIGDYTLYLGEELAKLGLQVEVMTSKKEGIYKPKGIVLHPTIQNFSLIGIWGILTQILKIKPVMINFQYLPQISGTFGCSISSGFFVLLLRIFSRAKLIATFHELYVDFSHNPFLCLLAFIQRLNFLIIAIFAHTIVVTTEERKRKIKRFFPGKTIESIPVGSNIPLTRTTSEERNQLKRKYAGSSEFIFTTFGTASRNKDYLSIIALIKELNHLDLPSNLVLIGDIERDRIILNNILDEVSKSNLTNKVFLTGKLDKQSISKLLQSCDYFLINQKKGLTTGSGSLATAFEHKIPVIASIHKLNSELFISRKAVLLVEMNHKSTAAQAMITIMKTENLVKETVNNAYQTFQTDLSWDIIASRVNSLNQKNN
jgi:glycosyltransferase involved in cell wall biosynthesis